MPSNLKKFVRERMARTGESYQTAHRYVTQAHIGLPNQAALAARPDPIRKETVEVEPLRHHLHYVRTRVHVGGQSVDLNFDLFDHGIGVSLTGSGNNPLAEREAWKVGNRYKVERRDELLTMLREAQYERFRADNGGVSWRLETDNGRISFWFCDPDDEKPTMLSSGHDIDRDAAERQSIEEFAAMPEDRKRRLFDIAGVLRTEQSAAVLEPSQQLAFVTQYMPSAAGHDVGYVLKRNAPSLRPQDDRVLGGVIREVETVPVFFRRTVRPGADGATVPAWIYEGPVWVDDDDVRIANGEQHLEKWLRAVCGADELRIVRRKGRSTFIHAAFVR